MSVLSERLAKMRKNRGLTQQQVVDQSNGLIGTIQVYSNYEKGNRNPDYETLCRLATIYGVTTDFLLGRDDEEIPQIEDFIKEANIPRELSNFLLFTRKNTFDGYKTYDAICNLLSSHEFIKSLHIIGQICTIYTPTAHGEHPSGIDGCKLQNHVHKLRREVLNETGNLYTVCNIDDVYDGKIYLAQQYFSKAIENLIHDFAKK